MVFFVPHVRIYETSFAPNRMFIRRTVWPQLTLVTHLLTYLLTYLQHGDNNGRSFSLRNDLLKMSTGASWGRNGKSCDAVRNVTKLTANRPKTLIAGENLMEDLNHTKIKFFC
jgi:hypothetical protein